MQIQYKHIPQEQLNPLSSSSTSPSPTSPTSPYHPNPNPNHPQQTLCESSRIINVNLVLALIAEFVQNSIFKLKYFVVIVGIVVGGYGALYWWYLQPMLDQLGGYVEELNSIQRMVGNFQGVQASYAYIQKARHVIVPDHLPESNLSILSLDDYEYIKQYSEGYIDNFEFARTLFGNWLQPNPLIDQAEYYRFNKTYNLDKQIPQKRMCIMAPFRNLLKYGTTNGSFQIFLKSLNAQNYSNYHVYMIDDASTDNSSSTILAQLKHYPRLNNRITILRNQKQVGALGNRDSTTRKYCGTGDVVMDVDGDDALIGKQVFNFVNRLYYDNPDAWFVYTNFIQIKGDTQGDGRHISIDTSKAQRGICKKIREYIHIRNSYRTELDFWQTSQLRTYLWDLYTKIPLSYVIEKSTGKYYFQASDRFTMYALVELAGINHTYHFPEFNYFYYQPNFDAWRVEKKACTLKVLFYCQAQARVLTPLMPLKSLSQEAVQTPNYEIPNKIVKYFMASQFDLFQCLKQKWAINSSQF